jgi:hypothetical protein
VRARRLAAASIVAAASIALFFVSRGKWSDALIDSGREWIVPDALSRGELLYRDVVYWFGPFTPYFQAAFFRIFGSGFQTLVLAGVVSSIAILLCLRLSMRVVTDERQAGAWTVLAIPLLIFMPDAGGAILGMGFRMWHAAGFGLLAVMFAVRRPGTRWMDAAAGVAAGFAGLCRTEWGLAVLVGVAVGVALRSSGELPLPALSRVAAGFLLTFGGGLGYFIVRAGPAAVLRDAPVLLFNLPEETRTQVAGGHPGSWGTGLVQMGYCAFVWLAALVLLEIAAGPRSEPGFARRRLPILGGFILLAGFCAMIGGLPKNVLLAGTPLLCAAAVAVSFRTPRGPLAAALGGFGTVGVLTGIRRPFFITDGPYVAPSILFALVCAAACLSRTLARRDALSRKRLSTVLVVGVAALAAILFVVRALEYASDDRVPIAGTGGMLSARPELAREFEAVARAVRGATTAGDGLVVFPEGEILNFLSGRPNPIRHQLYLPGYLNRDNEAEILAELSRARPGAIVVWPRPLGEYGRAGFGLDYGTSIRAWMDREYADTPVAGIARRGPVLLRARARTGS